MKVRGGLVGERIRLIHTNDPYTRLRPGDTGVVMFIDDADTIHVDWDSGSRLGLVVDAGDRFEVVMTEEAA